MSARSPFQKQVFDVLSGNAPLMAALVAPGVYSGVAPAVSDSGDTSLFPYVTIGVIDNTDEGTATENGEDFLVRVHTWSASKGSKECLDIQDLIYTALHRQSSLMAIAGHSILFIDRVGSFNTDDDPNGRFHGVCEYRALITRD